MTSANGRSADHDIDPLFLERWSPRSFSGEPMADADLQRLFEAARWAPSSNNQQPWRFLYAKRDTADWPLFLDLLSDGNKRWAADAAVLLAIVSKTMRDGRDGEAARENRSHSFDTGAAWACLALQASISGWATHAMGGFDLARATADLRVPPLYRIEAMVAVGRYAPAEDKPAQPNGRSSQTSFARQGTFPDG